MNNYSKVIKDWIHPKKYKFIGEITKNNFFTIYPSTVYKVSIIPSFFSKKITGRIHSLDERYTWDCVYPSREKFYQNWQEVNND